MEIASALQRSSGSASQAGVSFEELASYITVLSSTTRRSAETIGESLKTIFARMSDLKMGFDVEDGTSISNVEDALSDVDIKLRDSKNSFRDFSDVLQELAGKWGTLTEIEQANLGKQIAGTRQRELFYVLMTNMDKALEFQEIQTNASGLAMERYGEYLEGVEAAQAGMNAEWEKFWQEGISSESISEFYRFIEGVIKLTNDIGGLKAAIAIVTTALIVFKSVAIAGKIEMGISAAASAFTSLSGAISLATIKQWALNIAMNANPIGLVVSAVALLAGGLTILALNTETASEKLEKLNNKIKGFDEDISSLRTNAQQVDELVKKYEELKKEFDETGESSQEFYDVQNKLKELAPTIMGYYDELGNYIISDKNNMDLLTKSIYDQIEAKKKLRQATLEESMDLQIQNLSQLAHKKELADKGKTVRGTNISEVGMAQVNLDWSEAVAQTKAAFSEMSVEGQKEFIYKLKEKGGLFSELGDELRGYYISALEEQDEAEKKTAASVNEGNKALEEKAEKYKGLSETVKSLVDQPIDDLIQKSMSEGISFDEIEKIPEEYLNALTVEGDKLKLNIDLIKEYQLEQAKKSLEIARAAEATGKATTQEVQVLQLYYDQLLAQSQNTFGQFGQTAWGYDQLLWQISNDAVAAGYSFVDMEGNALKSAEQIQQYLASSPAAFSNFTQQVANQTGRTVAEVTNIINQMIGNTISNLNAMQAASAGRYTAMAAQAGKTPTYNNVPALFPTPAPSYSGAGGGGTSSVTSKEQKEAEKLRKTEEAINSARQKGIDALKDQLKAYKDIIDVRKDLLDSLAEEREYNKDLEEKKDSISDIQNQIIELSMDDSEEAKARTLVLQEELSKAQSDLEDFQYERSIDVQKSALDKEYETLESKINSAIQQIENIDASSLKNFTQQMAAILAGMGLESHHKGLDSGAVGGKGGNEMFIKALKGEILVNEAQQENFMSKILPSMINSPQVSSLGGGNISLEMPINVAGNLDKTVMPDLERIASFVVKKINDSMLSRGYNRRTDMYALG
jgi:hypothetical protein